MTIQPTPSPSGELRDFAIARLRKKRELQAHLIAYATVNLFLIGIWYATMPGGFFWPMFPLLGWGIGLIFHIWDVYSPEAFSEARIQREMQRVAGKR